MGLAFWRRTAGGHPVVEHQGIIPGFDSQILAAPDDEVGLMAFTNGASRAVQWMPVEMSRLLHHLLGVPDDVIPPDVPQRPEIWGDICGWYYLPGPLTDVRLRTIAGAGVEVFVRRGQLILRFLTPIPALYRGFPLHPADDTDPYVFRMDLSDFGLGPFTVVFSREPKTQTTAVHFDVMPVSRVQEDSDHEPEAVGRRGTRPLDHGDPQPQTPPDTTPPQDLAGQLCRASVRCPRPLHAAHRVRCAYPATFEGASAWLHVNPGAGWVR